MYFDGLGRPLQQVAVQQSATGQNIVTPITYDSFGRQDKDYLPVPVGTSLGYIDNATVISDPNSYYYNTYGNGGNDWNYRYSEKKFDQSPLRRVLEQGAPGEDWSLANGHTIKMDYLTNTQGEVKLFKAVANATNSLIVVLSQNPTHYPAESLYKSVVKDENWSTSAGKNHTTEEFKNKEGQVVLKRTYSGDVQHDTYYVYDQYGNLSFVFPPLAENPTDLEVMKNLCYQYKYDSRNRLIEKKLPGKQWEFIVYDKLDRVVATGPVYSPFGTGENGWSVTKYDAFSRPVLTGWYTNGVINSTAREVLQGSYNGTVVNLVKGSSLVDGISVGYAATSLPSGFKLLTVNYYDDYTFPDGPTVFPSGLNNEYEVYYNNSDKKPKGMATGSWIRVLTSASSTVGEKSYTLYDIKGRPVKSYSTNYLGGFISTETKLDFVGKPIYTVTKHLKEAVGTPIELREDFTYSAQDRLLTHVHEIVGHKPPELLAQNEYDEMGQLKRKSVGGDAASGQGSLQKIDYNYNIRGWLKEINNVDDLSLNADPRDLFAFKINYNEVKHAVGNVEKLYNGNISETHWITDGDNKPRNYGYEYDALNRLLQANYQKGSKEDNTYVESHSYDETLTYDKNGNISTLLRNGFIDGNSAGMTYPIDDLIYTYDNYNNSNRLLSVHDTSNSLDGFKEGYTSGDDYGYDNYGNMIYDRNKGIDKILYNHLNLPTRIIFSNSSEIQYLYNAAGVKVLKKVASAVTGYELDGDTHYLSGFQYKDNELQFFPTAEGYVSVTNGDKFNYVYNYLDHLGNIRLSYTQEGSDVKIVEENHYYPFGMKHSYNSSIREWGEGIGGTHYAILRPVVRNKNQYKYNGKEFQDELGLNMYDYGARNYDPAIGRWMNIDPLAETSRRFSPFTYCLNNPVFFIDPDGMQAEDHIPPKKKENSVSQTALKGALKGVGNRLGDYWDFAKKVVNDPKGAGLDVLETTAKSLIGIQSFIKDPVSGLSSMSDGITARATASEDPVDELGQIMGEIGTDVVAGELVGAGIARIGGLGFASEELTVFRVFGDDAAMDGFSWTTVHPESVSDFRGKAGLPSGGASKKTNSATQKVKGTVNKSNIINRRAALPLDGNMGGLDELIINPRNVKNKQISPN